MSIFITLAILPIVAHIVSCESTKEPLKDIPAKTTVRTPIIAVPTSVDPLTTLSQRSLWVKHPMSQLDEQSKSQWEEKGDKYNILLKTPRSLTKLAKTLSLGFDPYFSKDYFEPFERRPRPVTLVAFRKNGYVSRNLIKHKDMQSSETAELQSPFNEISRFWQSIQF